MSTMPIDIGEKFGIWALDPGGMSGGAWGVFLRCSTVSETLGSGTVDCGEFGGDAVEQAFDIYGTFSPWARRLQRARVPVAFVAETFSLRQRNVELSPLLVTGAVRALLRLDEYRLDARSYQEAALAKSYATRERLEHWDLWRLGRGSRDHRKDALRHLALAVSRVLDGGDVGFHSLWAES